MRSAFNPLGILLGDSMADIFPGAVVESATPTPPEGWLLCNGQEVSRTTYSKLFEAIGVLYGFGDGSTTFNVPDYRDKFLEMTYEDSKYRLGQSVPEGLPNIEGSIYQTQDVYNDLVDDVNGSGAFYIGYDSAQRHSGLNTDQYHSNLFSINFKASLSNAIYGRSTTVQPPAIIVNYFIKY